MNDPFDLKRHIGTVQDYPIGGITFRDITTLLETPSAFVRACDEMAKLCAEFNPTAIASIESRGFVLLVHWRANWLYLWCWHGSQANCQI